MVKRTFRSAIARVAIIAGTLHPKPMTNGMNECPCSPTPRITLSMRNTARAMYPVSSSIAMQKNRIMMCGKNTITLPTPPITAPSIKSRRGPAGKYVSTRPPIHPTRLSIHCSGYSPTVNVSQNIKKINPKNIGSPNQRLVRTLSILCCKDFCSLRNLRVYARCTTLAIKA